MTTWSKNNQKIKNIWQSRFYDHVIRHEEDLDRIREYILLNPLNWESDRNNSENGLWE